MNGYKRFIPKKARFIILRACRFIPDKPMLKFQYFVKLKRKLALKNPKRYTEKIQWYKLYYRNEKMPVCVDKYRVREYLREKGLSDIAVKLYAAYDDAGQIRLEDLPEKFILKTSNGSGTNIICKDKNKIDEKEVRKKVAAFLNQSGASAGREWAYSYVKPKIIVEELLEDGKTPDGAICDYKFLCFGGQPEYVVYDTDRFTGHKRNIYDLEWKDLHIESDCPCCEKAVPKPDNLEEMIRIAKILSEDFPAVRVDLYSVNGKVYFGELTFFPWSGYVQFTPDKFDFEVGEKFILPEIPKLK